MTDRQLFLLACEAVIAHGEGIRKAVCTQDAIEALIGLVNSMDSAGTLWCTHLYEGKTLCQWWHELKKDQQPILWDGQAEWEATKKAEKSQQPLE